MRHSFIPPGPLRKLRGVNPLLGLIVLALTLWTIHPVAHHHHSVHDTTSRCALLMQGTNPTPLVVAPPVPEPVALVEIDLPAPVVTAAPAFQKILPLGPPRAPPAA